MISEVLLENASAVDTSGAAEMLGATRGAVYIVFSSGTTAGAVVVETAHRQDFSGTWKAIATVSAAANTVERVALDGCFKTVRARVSTAIAGGSASAYIFGVS